MKASNNAATHAKGNNNLCSNLRDTVADDQATQKSKSRSYAQ